jgi:hypothetical protein
MKVGILINLKKNLRIVMDNQSFRPYERSPDKSDKSTDKPDCYGNLAIVFPLTENGLRETPRYCRYECSYKTECLKKAIATSKGRIVEDELLERGSKAGTIGFFERWSRKKQLERRKD